MKKLIIPIFVVLITIVCYDIFFTSEIKAKIKNIFIQEQSLNTSTINKVESNNQNSNNNLNNTNLQEQNKNQYFCYWTSSLDKNTLTKLSNYLDKLNVDSYNLSAKTNLPVYHIIWGLHIDEKEAYAILNKIQSSGLFKDKKIVLKNVDGVYSMNMAQYTDLSLANKELFYLKSGGNVFGGVWSVKKTISPTYYLDIKSKSNVLDTYLSNTFKSLTFSKKSC